MRGALESSLLVALCLFLGGCITADSSTAEHSLEAAQPSLGHMIEQPQFSASQVLSYRFINKKAMSCWRRQNKHL